MSILIYHNGALGDFLTTLPLIKLLRITAEDSITLLGNPLYAQIAKAAGLIDQTLDINSQIFIPLFKDFYDIKITELLKGYNQFLLFSNHDSPLVKNISKLTDIKVLVQPPFPPHENIHIIDYHLSLLNWKKTADFEILPDFKIPQSDQQKAMNILSDVTQPVILCPGSGSPRKNWPLERYKELSELLEIQGFDILWVCGPAEENFCFQLNHKVIRNPELLTLSALLKNSLFYIGNDSGITHLAAMTGCRCIALFGASNPRVWAPAGKQVRIVYKELSCSPCHFKTTAPVKCNRSCMESITVEMVLREMGIIRKP